MDMYLTRRQTLTCALIYAASLSGCCLIRPSPRPMCPTSPEVSYPNGPLTIDAHCHVFNGTDLQVADFISKVAIHQKGIFGVGAKALGGLLKEIAWGVAPSGEAELHELVRVNQELVLCQTTQVSERIVRMYRDSRDKAAKELNASLDRALAKKSISLNALDIGPEQEIQNAAIPLIRGLTATDGIGINVQNFSTMTQAQKTAAGMLAFISQHLQYRYVSVHNYLDTYNQPSKRVIDLMTPSMVDYDGWLTNKGVIRTITPLNTQVQVMEQISILTSGRVHAFVPFNPLKQVAYDLRFTSEDSLGLVKEAILSHGCIGVKLYPPMGFAALGNSDLHGGNGKSFWDRPWLPEITSRSDFGSRLDEAMSQLFSWCEKEQVPVMAHTSISNGVSMDFQRLAGAQYWAKALATFKHLRVSFGHFGGASDESGAVSGAGFANLMQPTANAAGEFAYADSGYFAEVLTDEPQLLETLKKLYDATASKGSAALANRFMYGTDWEMTLAQGKIDTYLSDFERLMQELESRPAIKHAGLGGLANKFFGQNAADWIGLHKGGSARKRLDKFYAGNGMGLPDWAKKVDGLVSNQE
ncbi:hypothetical protein ACIOYV_01815 [Pseudomonas sp. NPDC087342]|uniref:hypothetical protein n=1 Tax=Pseudomonas sp. NPDC087342 TaxID=3364437 RepID=UPI00381FEEC5